MRPSSPPSLPEVRSGQRPGLMPAPFSAVCGWGAFPFKVMAFSAVMITAPLALQAQIAPPTGLDPRFEIGPMPAPQPVAEEDVARQPSGAPAPDDIGPPKDAEEPLPAPAVENPAVVTAPAPVPPVTYSGSMEPCLLGHGQRDLYRAGLLATGWVDISEAGRPVAIAMLADAFLPITGAMDGPWEDHLAHRPASHQFWAEMAQNRTLMEREGRILLLAGFLDANGEMRVECWTAGPQTTATDSFFLLAGQVWQSEGVMMTQLNIPATEVTAESEILVSRITPPGPMDPPLAASDGLRTTTIFPMQGSQL